MFCKAEVTPFGMMDERLTLHQAFREGVIMVNKLDDRTCATCLCKLNDVYTRKKHEKAVHDGVKPNKFCCSECGKAYMNSNALSYHMKKHGIPEKFSCEECGKQFEIVQRMIAKKLECKNCLSPIHQFQI